MKNYYELIKILKDQVNINILQEIKEDFNNDFREELSKIQINNTTRKNAIKAYLNFDAIKIWRCTCFAYYFRKF